MRAPIQGIQQECVESIHSKLPGHFMDTHSQLLDQLTQEVKQMYYNSMKRVTGKLLLLLFSYT